MKTLGILEEITDLREVWPHEAKDFTPWLTEEANMAILADAVGFDITVEEQESSVGDFNVDIFASETGTDRKIIIENQLEDTNHDHLGKLITYASGKSANVIIWLVKRAREEHRAAIEWLNNHTDDNIGFFLCEIKLYRIGNSEPAVKFNVVEKPNDWTKEIKKANNMFDASGQIRFDYWTAFTNYAFSNDVFAKQFRKRKPTKDHWISFGIGSSACSLIASRLQSDNEVVVELRIYDNKDLYHTFEFHRDEIEGELGFIMEWYELPERKASRILVRKNVDLKDKAEWSGQFEWIMDRMLAMKKAFKNYI